MKKDKHLPSSYSYNEEMTVVLEEEELIIWGDYMADRMRDESEYDFPNPPQNIEEALEILESANEFFEEV